MKFLLWKLRNFLAKIYRRVEPFSDERLNIFIFMSFFLVCAFTVKLLLLTASRNKIYLKRVLSQYGGKLVLKSERGKIYDRNNTPLAESIKVSSFYMRPALIKNKRLFLKLCKTFIKEPEVVRAVESNLNKKKLFLWILKDYNKMPDEIYPQIRKVLMAYISYLRKNGKDIPVFQDLLEVVPEYKRVYPYRVGSSVVGVLNSAGHGISGLEEFLERAKIITGEKATLTAKRDAFGDIFVGNPAAVFEYYKKGNNVVTTIDGNLQYILEDIASKYAKKFHPNFINIVLMNPNTGDILAAVSYPFYIYGSKRGRRFISEINPRFITVPYEPGSVMKPFVLAAALNEGLLSVNSPIYCPRFYKVGDKFIHNEFGHNVTLSAWQVIKYSDNVGIVKILQKLGRKKFYEYLLKFGFGRKTGVELPAEAGYPIGNWRKWRDIDFATMAYGHHILTTTLQLAQAYSALVNGGWLVKPRLLLAVVNDKGEVIKSFPVVKRGRVLSKSVSLQMRRVLESVVERGGTGYSTSLVNYYVGGKTGTARKFDRKLGRYSRTKIDATFAGAFPITNPKFVLVITVDRPRVSKDKLWASDIAVPMFKEIAERVLLYERTPPDKYKYELTSNGTLLRYRINVNFPLKKGYFRPNWEKKND